MIEINDDNKKYQEVSKNYDKITKSVETKVDKI